MSETQLPHVPVRKSCWDLGIIAIAALGQTLWSSLLVGLGFLRAEKTVMVSLDIRS